MPQSASTSDAAQAIAAAVAQIELALREVQPPVEQLGLLIDRMSSGLGVLRASQRRGVSSEVVTGLPVELDRAVDELQKQLNGSIAHLQFYDRLVQHLGHIQDYLSGTAGELANRSTSAPQVVDVWDELRDKLRTRLISDAQRQLLDVMLPPPQGIELDSEQARRELAAQGSVELF